MEMKKVLKYAMEIGECMLVSGAGVSRVEDTISRICKAYGAKEANVFSITSSIVTTIEDEKGEILTQTKRIRSYKTDFSLFNLCDLSFYFLFFRKFFYRKCRDRIHHKTDGHIDNSYRSPCCCPATS